MHITFASWKVAALWLGQVSVGTLPERMHRVTETPIVYRVVRADIHDVRYVLATCVRGMLVSVPAVTYLP